MSMDKQMGSTIKRSNLVSKTKCFNLLRESKQLVAMLEQLSLGLSKSDIHSSEIAWEGYIQNLELIKSKIIEANSIIESEENLVSSPKVSIRLNKESELSNAIAKRIRKVPEGKFREVPLTYNEELEDFNEDRMVR
jgi:hypothetical protein